MQGDPGLQQAERRVVSLRLLGTRVFIEGPAPALRVYNLLFGWFIDLDDGREQPDLAFRIFPVDGGTGLRVEQDGKREELRLPTEDRAFGFIYARILDQVTRRDPDLLCLHAASLSRCGQGLAIAAPSQHGKSTLSLALSARGFTFLSDEVAPIRKSTRMLLPFPMAIGCRPGTYDLLRGTEFERHTFTSHEYTDKRLYDPLAGNGPAPEPVPIRAVVFLEQPDDTSRARRRYRIFLDGPASGVESGLSSVAGVLSASIDADGQCVTLDVQASAWVAPAVEDLLAREGVMVTAVEDLDVPSPDFEADPRLTRLPTSDGVLSMLHHLRGFAAVQDLAEATPGGFGALLLNLAEAFRPVGFYRLTPGRLGGLVAAIESVVES